VTVTNSGPPPAPARRADAGSIRLGDRDIAGLLLCGEMYGAPYDLLATALDVQPARLRAITARWRTAGYAHTGRLGPGPAWCWLTRRGMAVTGLGYLPSPPSVGRLAHIRAVLAVRLSMQDSPAYQTGAAWWRSERRIRAAAGWGRPGGHVPDAEVTWPDTSPDYPGECWALEAAHIPASAAEKAQQDSGPRRQAAPAARQDQHRRTGPDHRTGNTRRPRRPRRPSPAQPHPRPVHRTLRPAHRTGDQARHPPGPQPGRPERPHLARRAAYPRGHPQQRPRRAH
jgi:hypothetical protein